MSDYRAIAASIADELTEHPERWTQRAVAKNSNGENCERRLGISFCLIGHIWQRCDPDDELKRDYGLEVQVENVFKSHLPERSIVRFNDEEGRTVQDIIDLCRKVANS